MRVRRYPRSCLKEATLERIPTITTTALLDALGNAADQGVWEELDGRYRPVLFHLGRRMGLRDEDAADAAQETLLEFFRDYRAGRYQRERGRLRHWLLAIARHRVRDALARRRRDAPLHGDTWIDAQPAESELERIFEAEVGEEILRRALAALRRTSDFDEKTMAVFEAYVLLGREPAEVGAAHGLALGSVYAIKSRGLKRLGELRTELARAFEEA